MTIKQFYHAYQNTPPSDRQWRVPGCNYRTLEEVHQELQDLDMQLACAGQCMVDARESNEIKRLQQDIVDRAEPTIKAWSWDFKVSACGDAACYETNKP